VRSFTASSLIHAGLIGIALVCGLRLASTGTGRTETVALAAPRLVEAPFEEVFETLVEPEESQPEPEEDPELEFEAPLLEPLQELPTELEAPDFGSGFFLHAVLERINDTPVPITEEIAEPEPADPVQEPSVQPVPEEVPGPIVVEALLLESPQPHYPRASIRRGEEGRSLCRLHIAADGRVSQVEILESSGHTRLDEAARKGLLRWRFRPRTADGLGVPARLDHPVSFRLK